MNARLTFEVRSKDRLRFQDTSEPCEAKLVFKYTHLKNRAWTLGRHRRRTSCFMIHGKPRIYNTYKTLLASSDHGIGSGWGSNALFLYCPPPYFGPSGQSDHPTWSCGDISCARRKLFGQPTLLCLAADEVGPVERRGTGETKLTMSATVFPP